ncbi:MAG: phosphoribosylglycinamide formyltransferase, partial [Acidimicrobiales bacterium]
MRIAVLASGTGTILSAILAADLPVALVVADRRCAALDIAAAAGVEAELVERDSFGADFDRLAYTHRLLDALVARAVELVVMAGFATVLDKPIFDAFEGRVLNTHPSLLPAFPGWHAVEAALAAGVRVTGCTVHVATVDVDTGPILA